MKLSLPTKLGITVIIIFGLLILGMVLWRPMKVRYYAAKLHSDDIKTRLHAAKILLDMDVKELEVDCYLTYLNLGDNKVRQDVTTKLLEQDNTRPLFEYYAKLYKSKDVKKRIALVDELCAYGGKGKKLMEKIFRNRCYSEQARIPAGKLKLPKHRLVKIWMVHKTPGGYHAEMVRQEFRPNPSHAEIPSLYVDKFEVTFEKLYVYMRCIGGNAARIYRRSAQIFEKTLPGYKPGKFDETIINECLRAEYPVTTIRIEDAEAYAEWLGMRLPTEHEWKYAALAGSKDKFLFDRDKRRLGEHAWYSENSGGLPHPVGLKKPNEWGLYDVFGNAWEWCDFEEREPWDRRAYGGSYYSEKYEMFGVLVDDFGSFKGFRCVRDIKQTE
ncbi:MAG: formylglycine-generating enzyme family protein [Planctomycetota bacterium]|nr:MAG: formylglycine-generating enzyme family protein [Planctomycetota bacterium]